MRLVGTASYPNDGSDFAARGGIIAHQIGYGKTVVIIALVSLMRDFDASNSIEQRERIAKRLYENDTAFIHLKATLIVVPTHIASQWKNEFDKFLGKDKLVIVTIRAAADWRKMTLKKLQSADIIIISTALWSTAYSDMWTRSFAINPTVTKESPRERTDRYRLFFQSLRAVVAHWHRPGVSGTQANEHAAALMAAAEAEYKEHAKKFVGGSTRKGRAGPGGRQEDQEAEEEGNGGEVAGEVESRSEGTGKPRLGRKTSWSPIMFLENFSFARVVLDEFSYKDKPDVFLFLAEALAGSKWLLSGTPRLGNLADVDDLARPLQVHVTRPDPCVRSDLDPISRGPVLEPTALGEEIRLHAAALRSCNFALGRHQVAEDFIRHFLRADKTDRTGLFVEEAVVPLQIPLHARLVYHVVELMLSLTRENLFDLPYEARRALGVKIEKGKDGREEAQRFLLSLATRPSTLDTVAEVRDASDRLVSLNTTHLKSFSDKLIWSVSRSGRALLDESLTIAMRKDYEEKLQLVRQLVEARVAGHRRLSSEDGGEPVGYESFGGKVYGLELLRHLYPSPASAPAEETPSSAWWTNFRGNGARFFWPDWFKFDGEVVAWLGEGGDASDKEVVDLVVDAVLFARTHQAGRAINLANEEGWLEKHVVVVRLVLAERHLPDVLSRRDDPLADGLTTQSVEDLVVQYTRGEQVDFLLKCSNAREEWKGASPKHPELTIPDIEESGKSDLLDKCGSYQLKIAPSAGVQNLRGKLKNHFSESLRTSAYVDGRAFHVLSILPIPGRMVSQDGGKNEAVVEEMLGAWQQVESCQQDLVEACRRRNLLRMIDGNNGGVEWAALESDGVPKCHCCSKPLTSSAGWAGCHVLVACGHRLCDVGKAAVPSGLSAVCPIPGCGALCRRSAIVPLAASDCAARHDPEDRQEKKEEVVDKLAYLIELVVQGIPQDDHVIIFTIFEDFAKSLDSQLKAWGVTTLSLIGQESTAKMTEDFKSGKARVLFMDPTHEHAAGSNLTVANHVIFVSPAAERDPYTRNMHHQQGIGRSLRQGQRKTVYIYNLMTESTIDESLLRGLTEERATQLAVVGGPSDPLVEYFKTAAKPWWSEEKSEATTTVAHWVAADLFRNGANGVSQPLSSSSAATVVHQSSSVPVAPAPSIPPVVAPAPIPPAAVTTAPPPPFQQQWSNQALPDDFESENNLYD